MDYDDDSPAPLSQEGDFDDVLWHFFYNAVWMIVILVGYVIFCSICISLYYNLPQWWMSYKAQKAGIPRSKEEIDEMLVKWRRGIGTEGEQDFDIHRQYADKRRELTEKYNEYKKESDKVQGKTKYVPPSSKQARARRRFAEQQGSDDKFDKYD